MNIQSKGRNKFGTEKTKQMSGLNVVGKTKKLKLIPTNLACKKRSTNQWAVLACFAFDDPKKTFLLYRQEHFQKSLELVKFLFGKVRQIEVNLLSFSLLPFIFYSPPSSWFSLFPFLSIFPFSSVSTLFFFFCV